MYFTYILQSETNGIIYIGSTNNLDDRLVRHNVDRNKYTKGKGPWNLLFQRSFETRAEAIQLEKQLKEMKSRQRMLRLIDAQSG